MKLAKLILPQNCILTGCLALFLVGASACCVHGQSHPDEKPVLSITKQIHTGGPTYTFRLFMLTSEGVSRYRILVYSADGSEIVQDLGEVRNGVGVEEHKHAFEVVDVDGDGFADIRLLGGFDKSGNVDKPWYKVWLYQPNTKTYAFRP